MAVTAQWHVAKAVKEASLSLFFFFFSTMLGNCAVRNLAMKPRGHNNT